MDRTSFITILLMGLATYATRFTGFYIAGRINMTPRFRYALTSIPIAILTSISAPMVINGTLAEKISAGAVILAAAAGRGLLFCMAVGITAVNLLRYLL